MSEIKNQFSLLRTVLGRLPGGKLPPNPKPNSNPNPKTNPKREAIFLGGNCPDTAANNHLIITFYLSQRQTSLYIKMSSLVNLITKKAYVCEK